MTTPASFSPSAAVATGQPRRRSKAWVLALIALLGLAGLVAWLFAPATPVPIAQPTLTEPPTDARTLEQGRYLSVLGNCQACHTPRGGPDFAGGKGIETPFGTVYGSNLTPSPSGLGAWNSADFWRALHHGQSRDGRLLNPAFPYTNTTLITREDSDALFAYFRSLPAVDTPNRPSAVHWPFNTQAALRVWRALYFKPGDSTQAPRHAAEPSTSPALLRGAYLVNGPAHCSACHVQRNALGGSEDMLGLSGGLIPVQNWYAPSLMDPAQAGVQDWPLGDIVALFQSGRSGAHTVTGPMADVVQHSTQHWQAQDLLAMATYLKQLPRQAVIAPPQDTTTKGASVVRGAKIYAQQCAACHGKQGEGVQLNDGQWAYPPLADNPTLRQNPPANLLQSVLYGGYAPSTPSHPRPFGMPPFAMALDNGELADVLSYLRLTWGQGAPPVSALEVQQLRGAVGR